MSRLTPLAPVLFAAAVLANGLYLNLALMGLVLPWPLDTFLFFLLAVPLWCLAQFIIVPHRYRVFHPGASWRDAYLYHRLFWLLKWAAIVRLMVLWIAWLVLTPISWLLSLAFIALEYIIMSHQDYLSVIYLKLMGARPADNPFVLAKSRALAEILGIPVPQLFVIPKNKSVRANGFAFPRRRKMVALTQAAIDNLTEDHLEFIIAHELAHLVQDRRRINLANHIFFYCMVSLIPIVLSSEHFYLFVIPALASFILIFWQNRQTRLLEQRADDLAIQTTGKPEAAIAAMARLRALNPSENLDRPGLHPPLRDREHQAAQKIDQRRP